jgi:integral membrane protein (TIGR00529 family)
MQQEGGCRPYLCESGEPLDKIARDRLFAAMVWLGFAASLAAILIISKKNLALGIISGAIVLGLFTLPIDVLFRQIIRTATDMSVILLALAMGIVPLLGGTMNAGGQIDSLVANLRIPRRYLLAVSAALMGLLPMPGGALLSAPILEKGGESVAPDLISAINNWFRHLFILIYPLSPALIVAAKITGLDVYRAVLYLLPGFALALVLGYLFFLRRVNGRVVNEGSFSFSQLTIPLMVILSAPALDFILKRLFHIGSLATLIGVSTALVLSILFSRAKIDMLDIAKRMKPWNFALIIVGMFLYLYIFQASPAGAVIAALPLPPLILAVTAGFALSLLTGRVQLPASIIFPVYMGAVGAVTAPIFAIIYMAVYFGYIISPVHPCLVVTCEYFRVPIRAMVARLAAPTLVVLVFVLGFSFLFS